MAQIHAHHAYSVALKYQPVSLNKHEKRQTKVVNCVNNTFSVYVIIKVFELHSLELIKSTPGILLR